jgi:MerR family transcriptional regulator, light-induced transcriptional regulator
VNEPGGPVDGSAFSAGAVARRLGVAVTTLRTWHQRYGLGPSLHEPGHHRRYTEQDIERLEAMQRLIAAGVAPADAARTVTSSASAKRRPVKTIEITPDTIQPVVRGLQRAAMRLDAAAVRPLVSQAVRRLGVVTAWDEVLRPVLVWIGERHAATGGLVEVEHLLSTNISAVLGAVPRPSPTVPLRIMLACADEEQHSLPVEALAAALAAAGIPTRSLGARVPTSALLAAIRRTGPTALLVWSHGHSTADPIQLEALVAEHHRPLVIAAAGPGWDPARLPPEVSRPSSLTEAISQLTAYLTFP